VRGLTRDLRDEARATGVMVITGVEQILRRRWGTIRLILRQNRRPTRDWAAALHTSIYAEMATLPRAEAEVFRRFINAERALERAV